MKPFKSTVAAALALSLSATLPALPAHAKEMSLDALLGLLADPAAGPDSLETGLAPYFDLVVRMEQEDDAEGGYYVGFEMVQDNRTAAALTCILAYPGSLPEWQENWSGDPDPFALAIQQPLADGAAGRRMCTYQRWDNIDTLNTWMARAADWANAAQLSGNLTAPALGDTHSAAGNSAKTGAPWAISLYMWEPRIGPLAEISFLHDIPAPAR